MCAYVLGSMLEFWLRCFYIYDLLGIATFLRSGSDQASPSCQVLCRRGGAWGFALDRRPCPFACRSTVRSAQGMGCRGRWDAVGMLGRVRSTDVPAHALLRSQSSHLIGWCSWGGTSVRMPSGVGNAGMRGHHVWRVFVRGCLSPSAAAGPFAPPAPGCPPEALKAGSAS